MKVDLIDRFVLGCVVRKYISPRGLAKEPPKIDVVSVKYNSGDPDAEILRIAQIFEMNRMGLVPGPGNG